ncbi:10785_t:CDS:2 [Funneliformis mosseae]|uniref:10785_t:CDS:1 n=1 Tax=Funneliformis mosseae TaxID=27381 RepID=A0A9N8VXX7_FUNMO|nr:10785_t:CDS:2 [Funneliformis mosseae]
MTFYLEFRLNACPICLICLDCKNEYGQKITCQARELEWKRKKIERDYILDFCHKPFTQKGATNQKITLDKEFVEWVLTSISPLIILLSHPNNINICIDCMNKYHKGERITNQQKSQILFLK